MKKVDTIDAYIADFSSDIQELLNQMRTTIKKAAPKAEEAISYGMPTFKLGGNLVHFAAAKNHIGFYPAPSGVIAFEDELKKNKFEYSKGAIQFPIDRKLPLTLVSNITKFRVKENEEKARSKVKKK